MNGTHLTLGLVGALAAAGALSRRGSRAARKPKPATLSSRRGGRNVHGQIPDEVVEVYSYGRCIDLAVALHEAHGWPIYAETDLLPDGTRFIAHAYVKHPSGVEIDILGPQTKVDSFAGHNGQIEGPLTPEGLAGLGGFQIKRSEVEEAARIMRRYVDPRLREEGLL